MYETNHSLHRFSNYEVSVTFTNDDGIDVFQTGARFQQCLGCGQTELRNNNRDVIQAFLTEKRKHPQSSGNQSLIDLP
jgi:hypothetical protein